VRWQRAGSLSVAGREERIALRAVDRLVGLERLAVGRIARQRARVGRARQLERQRQQHVQLLDLVRQTRAAVRVHLAVGPGRERGRGARDDGRVRDVEAQALTKEVGPDRVLVQASKATHMRERESE